MAGSISQSQKAYLKKPLDLGTDPLTIKNVDLTAVEKALLDLATTYVTEAEKGINKYNLTDTGKGQDSIQPTNISRKDRVLSIDVVGNAYLNFQDKGVSGTRNKIAGSPYSFKSENPSQKMVDAIEGWVSRGRARVQSVVKYTKMGNEQKATESAAYTIARAIKRHGIKSKPFLKEAENKLREEVIDKKMADALTIDILNSF